MPAVWPKPHLCSITHLKFAVQAEQQLQVMRSKLERRGQSTARHAAWFDGARSGERFPGRVGVQSNASCVIWSEMRRRADTPRLDEAVHETRSSRVCLHGVPRPSRLPETRLHDQQGDPAALRLADLHRSPSFSSPCPPRLGISDGSCPHSHSQHHCESVGHSGGRLLRGAAVCLIAPVRRVIGARPRRASFNKGLRAGTAAIRTQAPGHASY